MSLPSAEKQQETQSCRGSGSEQQQQQQGQGPQDAFQMYEKDQDRSTEDIIKNFKEQLFRRRTSTSPFPSLFILIDLIGWCSDPQRRR
jgi:hypothetical protein